ncbi:uncharacterized protein [Onthophagus taurus]|uniref:uncharacterized protein n=1 Tax=Onthophagus taurus TaxID=166361 RepID=UPI000C20E447|nr:phosphoglycolate phosphatase 1B, chloroplastic-like [Onthophagus taurus]
MTIPSDLTKISPIEFQEFINSFDTVLCDCDGVLIFVQKPVEGSPEAVINFKKIGKSVRYVTNNCTKTKKLFTESLKKAGYDLEEHDVISPAAAIIKYLKSINFDKKLFVMSLDGLQNDLIEAGFKLANTGPPQVEHESKAIVSAIFGLDDDVGAVIMDVDVNMNFIKLQRAILHLNDPQVLYMTAALDDMITIAKNVTLIGPQHFHGIVQKISGRSPLEFGKPGQKMIDYVKNEFKVDPNRTLFIGDTFSDMSFAHHAGYQKLLVLSGVVNKSDMESCKDDTLTPKYYLESLGELNNFLDKMQPSKNSSL